jgi:hypothetical protein
LGELLADLVEADFFGNFATKSNRLIEAVLGLLDVKDDVNMWIFVAFGWFFRGVF